MIEWCAVFKSAGVGLMRHQNEVDALKTIVVIQRSVRLSHFMERDHGLAHARHSCAKAFRANALRGHARPFD